MITLDIGALAAIEEAKAALNKDAVHRIVRDIAEAARAEWVRLAGRELSTSRSDYISSIQRVATVTPGVYRISLVGQPALIVEQGAEARDMRDFLLGPDVPVGPGGKKQSKNGGYYRSIPFRHGTPGSGGGAGVSMGTPYSAHAAVADAKALGAAIHTQAKELTPAGDLYGPAGRLHSPNYQGIPIPKLRPHHSTDIYSGMIRSPRSPGKERGSQYTTFRTISTNKTDGWMRPQIPGKNIASKVSDFVGRIAPESIEAYVSSL